MSMARICIVTPSQLASNPRAVKEALALYEQGHDVRVIAVKLTAKIEKLDAELAASLPFPVCRIDMNVPGRWASARLRQEAARKLFSLTGSARAADYGSAAAMPALRAEAVRYQADLYIGHYTGALPAVADAAAAHGSRFGFDAEDFHPGEFPASQHAGLTQRIIETVERRHLSNASLVTAAAPLIAEAYANQYGIPLPTTILNSFPRTSAPAANHSPTRAARGPSVYWFSQTIGPDRGLEAAVQAIAIASSRPHLHLRGYVSEEFRRVLESLANTCGVGDRVHFLEPVAARDLERLGAEYDLGLVGETGATLNRRIALTNKLFSYVTSGLAIVASDIPAHRAIAGRFAGALRLFTPNDPSSLAREIDAFLLHPEYLADARRSAWRLGQDGFSWENEKHRLLSAIGDVLRHRRSIDPACPLLSR
jgi:glycosyltransferase involved in cell wall biosynthesis